MSKNNNVMCEICKSTISKKGLKRHQRTKKCMKKKEEMKNKNNKIIEMSENKMKYGVCERTDNYLMDMENEALCKWEGKIPKKLERITNKKWLKHIEKYVDRGLGLDVAMEKYKNWVKLGGGDEWFIDE